MDDVNADYANRRGPMTVEEFLERRRLVELADRSVAALCAKARIPQLGGDES